MKHTFKNLITANAPDYYVVKYFDNKVSCHHETQLDSILQSILEETNVNIKQIAQCQTGNIVYDWKQSFINKIIESRKAKFQEWDERRYKD